MDHLASMGGRNTVIFPSSGTLTDLAALVKSHSDDGKKQVTVLCEDFNLPSQVQKNSLVNIDGVQVNLADYLRNQLSYGLSGTFPTGPNPDAIVLVGNNKKEMRLSEYWGGISKYWAGKTEGIILPDTKFTPTPFTYYFAYRPRNP